MTMLNTIAADRADFAKALAFAKRGAEKRNTIPILGHVLIRANGNKAMLHTTDVDRRIMVSFPLTQRAKAVSLTLPAHKLDDLTRKAKASDTITIAPVEDVAKGDFMTAIKFADLKVTMSGLDVTDFPELEIKETSHEFAIDSADFLKALERVEFAISTEETRYYLNGVFMHLHERKLRLVTTDGHRLAVADMKQPAGSAKMPDMIVPRMTIADLIAMLKVKGADDTVSVRIGKDDNGRAVLISFACGNITILSKLVDGTFPDYLRVIPTRNDKTLTANVEKLMSASKEVMCVQSERGRAVKLSLGGNRLTASTHNPDIGTAERTITVGYLHDPIEIGFNGNYLLDALDRLESEEVTIKLEDPGSPTIITGDDDPGFMAVLMPIRV